MDWNAIKAEYIAGGTSYRKLAKKYEVSASQLTKVAIREGWAALREQAESKAEAEMVKKGASARVKTDKKIINAADYILDMIIDIASSRSVKNTQDIKHLSSALKDIKEVKDVKSPSDLREQEARIKKLMEDTKLAKDRFEFEKQRAAFGTDDDDNETGVVMLPPVMEGGDGDE